MCMFYYYLQQSFIMLRRVFFIFKLTVSGRKEFCQSLNNMTIHLHSLKLMFQLGRDGI
jgi:hypothetical protein